MPASRSPNVRSLEAIKPNSPLRYPGGKAALAPFLQQTIRINRSTGGAYYEPFAGGAGAALRLLRDRIVSKVYLNDLDPCIFAFWHAALDQPKRFEEAIRHVPLSVDEWKFQKSIYSDKEYRTSKSFELGFATFYLNRCNRSGIIYGSAPIGGFAQKGRWRINARFNRDGLADRIHWLANHKSQIVLSNKDALAFLKEYIPHSQPHKKAFVYLDPPYVANGRRLYYNSYHDRDHRTLAEYLKRRRELKWVMSYDDVPLVKDIYGHMVRGYGILQYSLHAKRQAEELLIAPSHVKLPKGMQSYGN